MLARHARSVLLGAAIAVLLSEFFQYANTVVLPLVATPSNNPQLIVGSEALASARKPDNVLLGQSNDNHSLSVDNHRQGDELKVKAAANSSPGQRGLPRDWSQSKPVFNEALSVGDREPFKSHARVQSDPPHLSKSLPVPPATSRVVPLPPLPSLTLPTTPPQTILQPPKESIANKIAPASDISAVLDPPAAPPQILLQPLQRSSADSNSPPHNLAAPPQIPHDDRHEPISVSSISPDVDSVNSISITIVPASKVWVPAPPYTCAHGPVAYYTATPNSQVSVAQLKHRSAPSCRHSLQPRDLVVGVWHCAKCEALIASVEASWAADVTTVYLASAKGMAKAGPQVRELAAQGRVLNTGGSLDDYLSTLGKGLVGLQLMFQKFPDHAWFAIVGDDVLVRPFALTDSLSAFDPEQPWAFSQAAPHARHGFRAFGGAGIITSRACTRQLANQLGPWAAQTNKHGNSNDRLHDVAFVRLLAKQGMPLPPLMLSNLNGLFSQPPGFYLNSALGAKDLGASGMPLRAGTFHYVREGYMAHVHAIASTVCVHCRYIHDVLRSSSGAGGWLAALEAASHMKALRSLKPQPIKSSDSSSTIKSRRKLFGFIRGKKPEKAAVAVARSNGPSLMAPTDALEAFAALRQKVHASVVVTAASVSKREKDEKKSASERVKGAVASTWGASVKFSIVEAPPGPLPPPPPYPFSTLRVPRRLSSHEDADRRMSNNSSDPIQVDRSSRRRLSANRRPDIFHYAVHSALTAVQSPEFQFEWFLVISSHLYVVPSNLIALLSAHDPRQPILITCPRAWHSNEGGSSSNSRGKKKGSVPGAQPELLADSALECGMLLSRAAAEALLTSTASSPNQEGPTPNDHRRAQWSSASVVQALQSVGGLFVADSGLGAVGSGTGEGSPRKRSSSSSSSNSGRRNNEGDFDRQAAAATVGCGPDIIKGQEKRMMYETGTAALKVCHFLLLAARARQLGVGQLDCVSLKTDGRSKSGRVHLAEPSLCDL